MEKMNRSSVNCKTTSEVLLCIQLAFLKREGKGNIKRKQIAEIMAETFSIWMKTLSPRIKDAQRSKKENDTNENYNIV